VKVAHITLYPPKKSKHVSGSGVASYSKNLVTHLGVDDQVVICNVTSEKNELYDEDDVFVHRVFERTPRYIFEVHKELKRINPDVIHIQQELALFGGIFTAYLLQWLVFLWRKKTVVTLHGVVDPKKINQRFVKENNSNLPAWIVRIAFYIIYKPLMLWAKKIIVHEQYFKDIVVYSYGINGRKVAVIPHGIEMLEVEDKNTARGKLHISQDANVALYMGYATGYKGIDLLIEGFSKYADLNPKAYLIIGAGKHPKLLNDASYLAEYKRLEDKAKDMIPKNQYTWEGFIAEKDITMYYSASDVSLFPYTTAIASSGPMSFAIGYEKPFLVSSAFSHIFSQFPELLFDKNSEALAEKLDYFFSYEDVYASVSHKLKKERSWSRVAEQTALVYGSINQQKENYESEERVTTG
jgi:glycosyltransferase involved in cell wall biosynthesis